MTALALQSFGFEGNEVRTLFKGDVPWFVAQDVCGALELANSRQAIAALDDDERDVVSTDTTGGLRDVSIISESGMFALIFKSRKPSAVRFRKWVTSEVLPTLRRTGRYLMAPANDEPDIDSLLEAPDDIERFKVKLALVREARYVYGRHTARVIWEQVGLPDVKSQKPVLMEYSPDELDPVVERWMAARCVLHPQAKHESNALFHDYVAWCDEHGTVALSQRIFGEMLTKFGIRPRKSGRIMRLGIRLKD